MAPRRGAGRRASRARNPALNASPAPVVSAARIGDVATSNRSTRLPSRMRTVAPLRPRLTTAIGATSMRPSSSCLDPTSARDSSRVANTRSGRTSSSSASAARRPFASSGAVELRSTVTSAPASRARRVAAMPGEAQRLVEQRVGREVDGVRALEPLGLEVLRPEPERGAAILDEAALAAGLDEHADPARRRAGDPDRADLDAVAGDGRDERPADRVATDRAHEAAPRPEPAEPARGRRRAAALAEADAARDVGAALEVQAGRGRRRARGRRRRRSTGLLGGRRGRAGREAPGCGRLGTAD